MKFAFFGSPEFAAIVLDKIISAGLVPDILIANPDRPAGRKQVLTPPETKKLISARELSSQVKIFQPEKPALVISQLEELSADFFVVAAYAKIIPKSVLAIPRLGTIGVHPSLLPKYRGATPIQSALLGGEKKTGVALYLMSPGVDDGPVFTERELAILPHDNYMTLMPRLAELGGEMLAELIPRFLSGVPEPKPQDESEATLTKKFTSDDGFIDENELARAMGGENGLAFSLHNKIRAFYPEPGAWTKKSGMRIKLLESEFQNGALKLLRIQKEGKKPESFRPGVI